MLHLILFVNIMFLYQYVYLGILSSVVKLTELKKQVKVESESYLIKQVLNGIKKNVGY
jgi:hypothetical protein